MALPVVPAGLGWRMRRIATAAILAIATVFAALTPALGQGCTFACPSNSTPPVHTITPLGLYAMGSIACAAAAPIIGTIVLNRKLTASEVGRSTMSCVLGPIGWWLGTPLFPFEIRVP